MGRSWVSLGIAEICQKIILLKDWDWVGLGGFTHNLGLGWD